MRNAPRAVLVSILIVAALLRASGEESKAAALPQEKQLSILCGEPDIKVGVSLTKVAGFVWAWNHLVEEFDDQHIRVTLTQSKRLLPYTVDYYFDGGKLTRVERKPRATQPELDLILQNNFDDRPWPLIDRSLWGYAFRIPANWPLLFEKEFERPEFSFRFTVVALPRIYDQGIEQLVENSLQWSVFTKPGGYKTVEEVVASEEARLAGMGTEIVQKSDGGVPHAVVYKSRYRDQLYLGKTYYFVSDQKGFAVRFNATEGTYSKNLPRFEKFIAGFQLTRKRTEDPDIELIKDGNLTIMIVGGVMTEKDAREMKKEFYRPSK